MEQSKKMAKLAYEALDVLEVMEKEREIFIDRSMKNGYTKEIAEQVYNLILNPDSLA